MRYEVILVQTKSIVVDIEADTPDKAIYVAKEAAKTDPSDGFDKRIGKICVAGVRELE